MSDLDKLFKKKLEQRSFELKDAYWKEAERLIATEEGRRRRRAGWWIFGLLLFVVAGGAFYYSQVSPIPDNYRDIRQSPIPTAAAIEPLVNTIPEDLDLRSRGTGDSVSNKKEEQKITSKETDPNGFSFSEKDLIKNTTATSKREDNNGAGYVAATRRTDEIGPSTIEYKKNTQALNNSKIPIDNTTVYISSASNEKAISTTDASKVTSEQSYERSVQNADTPEPISKREKIAPVVALDLLETRGGDLLKKNEEVVNLPTLTKVHKSSRWQLGLELTTLHRFANMTGKYNGVAFGTVIDYNFNPKWSVQGGLRYSVRQSENFVQLGNSSSSNERNGSLDNTFVSTSNFYNFGLIQIDEITDIQQFHFVELPLGGQFRAKRHLFGVGVQLNYLTGARGEQSLQSFSPDLNTNAGSNPNPIEALNDQIPGSTQKRWLDRTPYKKWSTEAFLGYGYMLSPRWSVNLRTHFQLFNNGLDESSDAEILALFESQESQSVRKVDRVYFRLGISYTIGK